MKINIKRFQKSSNPQSTIVEFNTTKTNLLQAFNEIKTKTDSSFSYRCGCKSGVCGSCAVRVNGVEKLACKTVIKEGDLVEPLKNRPIIKDLVFDVSHETFLIKNTHSFMENKISTEEISQNDVQKIDRQSNCILCNSCYSSCPVYDVNKEFQGPFALTRALRYANDKKMANNSLIIDHIQTNGVWDCTLCGACTLVCPQGIDPKMDIMQLQNLSSQKGYTNPVLANFDSNMGFDMSDMGFDPNGGF